MVVSASLSNRTIVVGKTLLFLFRFKLKVIVQKKDVDFYIKV